VTTVRDHDTRQGVQTIETPSRGPAQQVGGAAGGILALQRRAGNRATASLLGGTVNRKIAAADTTADPDMGPVAEIADTSGLSSTQKAAADEALANSKTCATFDDLPWVQAQATAGTPVSNRVKRRFKWHWPHRNRDGHLPGKKGAGGYKEYYIRTGTADTDRDSDYERLVISDSTGDVFHTATHYGEHPAGSVAFTHYK
jgi:hypothetical protein